jgi:hypothetical protein
VDSHAPVRHWIVVSLHVYAFKTSSDTFWQSFQASIRRRYSSTVSSPCPKQTFSSPWLASKSSFTNWTFTPTTFSTEYDWMQMIVDRSKTYEFRKGRYPTSVLRIWFYQTAPISAITYICEIDPGLTRDPSNPLPLNGHRNKEFNEGIQPDWRYNFHTLVISRNLASLHLGLSTFGRPPHISPLFSSQWLHR